MEIESHVRFLEERVTLLETKLAKAAWSANNFMSVDQDLYKEKLVLNCNVPGMLVSSTHAMEKDESGANFYWLGGRGPIQITLPLPPTCNLAVTLVVEPHPAIDMDAVLVHVNGQRVSHHISKLMSGKTLILFHVEKELDSKIRIMLSNLGFVVPSERGESADSRMLSIRFFSAEIIQDEVSA